MMKLVQLCLCACVLVPSVAFGQETDDEKQSLSKQIEALRQELESKQAELAKILQKKDKKIQEMAVKLDKAAAELANAKRSIEASHAAAVRQKQVAESAAAKASEAAKKATKGRAAWTDAVFQLAANGEAINDRLADELKRLEAELAKAQTVYGKAHPAVKSLEQRARVLRGYIDRSATAVRLPPAKSKDAMRALEKRYEALRRAEAQMGKSEYSDALAKYRDQMRSELSRLETQMKMVQQDHEASAKALQEKRTAEMLEMRGRLERAQDLAKRDRAMFRFGHDRVANAADRQSPSIEKRLDKLEAKVDKIASLLERLIEKKAESKVPFMDKKEDE